MGAQARRTIIAPTMPKRSSMEPIDRLSIRGGEGEMEARPRRPLPLRPVFQCELVAPTRQPVADRLPGFARPQILPDPDMAQGRQYRVVESAGALDIGNAERQMMTHESGPPPPQARFRPPIQSAEFVRKIRAEAKAHATHLREKQTSAGR
jgi:hypothetical protein